MFPLRDNIPSRTVPVVNYALIAANILGFFYELALPALESFLMSKALMPARFVWGITHEPLDLSFTAVPMLLSMFLHGGWAHLVGNMLYLYIFGDNVEDRLGHLGYLLFYLVCGTVAGLAHVVMNLGSRVPTIGASGAVAGVMGAYLLLYPRARVRTLVFLFIFIQVVEVPAVVFLFFWFVVQFFQGAMSITSTFHGGTASGGVAWWAHIGGFASGVGIAWALRPRLRRRDFRARG